MQTSSEPRPVFDFCLVEFIINLLPGLGGPDFDSSDCTIDDRFPVDVELLSKGGGQGDSTLTIDAQLGCAGGEPAQRVRRRLSLGHSLAKARDHLFEFGLRPHCQRRNVRRVGHENHGTQLVAKLRRECYASFLVQRTLVCSYEQRSIPLARSIRLVLEVPT